MIATYQTENNSLEEITLPRGSGYIVKINRNTQHPYCARRYLYTDQKGNAHSKDLGYFKTKAEANRALLENISKTPLDLENTEKSFSEIYEIWLSKYQKQFSDTTLLSYKSAYSKCTSLYNKAYCDITVRDMQEIISRESSALNQLRLRVLFSKLDLVADSMDIIQKRRSSFLVIKRYYPKSARVPFSDNEIKHLLEHSDDPMVCHVLFVLYTAFRSGEVIALKKENVNLKEMTITGGKKTVAGHMRVIPIHPRIQSYVETQMKGSSEYLLTGPLGGKLSMHRIEEEFKRVSKKYCDRIHIPHECRHTFQTRLDMMGADKICVDMLMGHKPANVADRVYSHRSLETVNSFV